MSDQGLASSTGRLLLQVLLEPSEKSSRFLDAGGEIDFQSMFLLMVLIQLFENIKLSPLVCFAPTASADDPNKAAAEYMSAFDPNGGYAAIVQAWFGGTVTQRGARVGGVEIIRYSGVDGVNLKLEQRGITATELPRITQPANVQGMGPIATESRAFVIRWNPSVNVNIGQAQQEDPEWYLKYAVFVVPISVSVPSAAATDYDQHATMSRLAQLTHVTDAENTEWVRYDEFKQDRSQLVRCQLDRKPVRSLADIPFMNVSRRPRWTTVG